MLKKRLFFLLLCLLLLPIPYAPAQAEGNAYTPGRIADQLLKSAFLSGNMLCADVSLALDLNTGMFGLSEEEAAAADMVCNILRDASLTLGAARIPDGVALLLRGAYGAEPAEADAILSLTKDGAAVETSLLPGERISITWEDALRLSGLDESSSALLLGLRDIDPDQLLQLAVQYLELAQTTLSIAASPYIRIIEDFIAAQPVEIRTDAAAEGYFPAAAQETILIITQKTAGELLISLAGQLEHDMLLSSVLDGALSAVDPSADTAALCAAIRAAAAGMTDEQYPICFITGSDAARNPLYYSLCASDAGGVSYAVNLIDMTEDLAGEGHGALLQAFVSDSTSYSGLTATFFSASDPADESIRTIAAAAEVQLDNEYVFTGEYILSTVPFTTEDGFAAQETLQEYAIEALIDGSVLSSSGTTHVEQGQTENGEYTVSSSSTQGHLGEMQIMQTDSQASSFIAETETGLTGTYASQYAAPQQGVNDAQITCSFYTLPYVPDADAAVLDLGIADGEALDALALRLQQNAEPLLLKWIEQMPKAQEAEVAGPQQQPAAQANTL